MLKIRLKRVGRKHDPSYRIVVTEDFRGPKSGKYLENVGSYDPRKNIKSVKAGRVKYWISKGAQISDTVHNIFISEKIIDGKKRDVSSKKKGKKALEKDGKKEKSAEPQEKTKEAEKTEEIKVKEKTPTETPTETPIETPTEVSKK
ncbi:30S ribosomal protein S16 [Patescibacteria group bacterium]|nr:30S ribosomal protein S16 [Patescibacteria group bacterium]MBU4057724.1 30S ribosomal protein S16 [Patescibacteria group bacterium]MBU4115909.1 30S ribosomal protein S16 [Patescibacteria group bacterium]